MIVAKLTIKENDDGGRYLAGTTRYDLPTNTILVLRKVSETDYLLAR